MQLTRRFFLRTTFAAAAGLTLTALSGCTPGIPSALFLRRPQPAEPTPTPTPTAAPTPTPTSTPTPTPTPTPEVPYTPDPLTGAAPSRNAPQGCLVAVMVNNICGSARQNSRPQRGLSSADVLIECVVEGSITRFCALYSSVDAVPEVGPIRSGRDQYLQLIMPLRALYVHDGESMFCTRYINSYEYWDMNLGGKSYYDTPVHSLVSHRDSRGRDVAFEHTEFTSGREIRQSAQNGGLNLSRRSDRTIFAFADYRKNEVNTLPDCERAAEIEVFHSENYRSSFAYNKTQKRYFMSMYSVIDHGFSPAVDELNDKQLSFDNVVLCFADIHTYAGESGGVQEVNFAAGGDALVFTRGRVMPCAWHKVHPTEPLVLYDPITGHHVRLNVGKTYLGFVDIDRLEDCSFAP